MNDPEPIIVRLEDVARNNAGVTYTERAYRKGVCHGLWLAWEMLSSGAWDISDLSMACDIVLEWRFDNRPHGALCDELIRAVKEAKHITSVVKRHARKHKEHSDE